MAELTKSETELVNGFARGAATAGEFRERQRAALVLLAEVKAAVRSERLDLEKLEEVVWADVRERFPDGGQFGAQEFDRRNCGEGVDLTIERIKGGSAAVSHEEQVAAAARALDTFGAFDAEEPTTRDLSDQKYLRSQAEAALAALRGMHHA